MISKAIRWCKKRFERKQCLSLTDSSGLQCSKTTLPGSRYCWRHRITKTELTIALVLALLGWVANIFGDALKKRYIDRHPDLILYANGMPLNDDTVVFVENMGTNVTIRFKMKNAGNLESGHLVLSFRVTAQATNFISAPDWQIVPSAGIPPEPPGSSMNYNKLGRDVLLQPRNTQTWGFGEISVATSDVKIFGLDVSWNGSDFYLPKGRTLHFVRTNKPTPRLTGRAARSFIHQAFHTNYANHNTIGWKFGPGES